MKEKYDYKLTSKIINDFSWGKVYDFHEIAEYLIIEYYAKIYKGCTETEKHDKYTKFHLYIKGKDSNRCYHSIDEALIGAIAIKYDGYNSIAAKYFSRMIDIKGNEKSDNVKKQYSVRRLII